MVQATNTRYCSCCLLVSLFLHPLGCCLLVVDMLGLKPMNHPQKKVGLFNHVQPISIPKTPKTSMTSPQNPQETSKNHQTIHKKITELSISMFQPPDLALPRSGVVQPIPWRRKDGAEMREALAAMLTMLWKIDSWYMILADDFFLSYLCWQIGGSSVELGWESEIYSSFSKLQRQDGYVIYTFWPYFWALKFRAFFEPFPGVKFLGLNLGCWRFLIRIMSTAQQVSLLPGAIPSNKLHDMASSTQTLLTFLVGRTIRHVHYNI